MLKEQSPLIMELSRQHTEGGLTDADISAGKCKKLKSLLLQTAVFSTYQGPCTLALQLIRGVPVRS